MQPINPHLLQANGLLAALPATEHDRLLPLLKPVTLPLGALLYEPGQSIQHVYFPLTAMVSMISVVEDCVSVELGLIGNEGIVGVPAFLGVDTATFRAEVQIGGDAIRMHAGELRTEFRRGGGLHDLLLRHTHAVATGFAVMAFCNRCHTIDKRLASWLLRIHDRVNRDVFMLTQDSIAAMLGTRRASVSIAASVLREKKLIDYYRGQITIVNREGLEAAACKCYGTLRKEFDRLRLERRRVARVSPPVHPAFVTA